MTDLFLLRTALRDALRPQRLLLTLLLVALPALIALLARALTPAARFEAVETYNNLANLLVFGFILTILSVIFGTAVVSQEIEQRTIVYLLTRPVPRWRILLAKFLGSFIAITLTTALSALLLALAVYGPAKLGASPLGRDLLVLPVGALAYGSLFLLMSTLLARPLMFGLLFAFGWESWVPNLPGAFARLSIMAYLRVLAPHKAVPVSADVGEVVADPLAIAHWQAWLVLAAVIAIGLIGALVVFSRREYAPREDSE